MRPFPSAGGWGPELFRLAEVTCFIHRISRYRRQRVVKKTRDAHAYLRCHLEVDLEKAGLECGLLWLVALENVQEEGSSFLDKVPRHEEVNNLSDVHKGTAFVLGELEGKVCRTC